MPIIGLAHLLKKLRSYPDCDGNVRTIIDVSAYVPVRGNSKLRFSIHATDVNKLHAAATTRDEVTKKVGISLF